MNGRRTANEAFEPRTTQYDLRSIPPTTAGVRAITISNEEDMDQYEAGPSAYDQPQEYPVLAAQTTTLWQPFRGPEQRDPERCIDGDIQTWELEALIQDEEARTAKLLMLLQAMRSGTASASKSLLERLRSGVSLEALVESIQTTTARHLDPTSEAFNSSMCVSSVRQLVK